MKVILKRSQQDLERAGSTLGFSLEQLLSNQVIY